MTKYMPLFRLCTTSRTLTQLHAHLFVTGLHEDPLASTKLIESYAQMGSIHFANLVFDTFPKPDSFMWGVLIKCCVWNGFFQEAISMYHDMLYKLNQASNFIVPSVLRACSGFVHLGLSGQKVHGRIVKCGFESDPVVETSLLSMYGETGYVSDARKVFDQMSVRDVVSWSSIISSYVQNGKASEGLGIFKQMVAAEVIEIDSVTMLTAVEACADLGSRRQAEAIHGYVIRNGIKGDGSLDSSLISMYGRCGDLYSAECLFDSLVQRSTSSWTAMITCYNQSGHCREALDNFTQMLKSEAQPNVVTMLGVLCSCARLGWLKEGKSIHGAVFRRAIDPDNELLLPALIDLYANCGNLTYGRQIFSGTEVRHVVSWNMLISGYAREGLFEEALILFVQMNKQGTFPDSFTLATVLSACGDTGSSRIGHQMHGRVIKTGFSNEFVQTSLIDMYSKCGLADSAYMIFSDTQPRTAVTWNCMICGLSQNAKFIEAINLFDQMYSDCLDMDEVTLLSVVQACSSAGYLEKGKWVHHKLIVFGIKEDLYTDTALTDMYAKCGDLRMAQRVFDRMSERSVVSWSAMISGYGMHGQIDAAISLFNKMVDTGVKPNEITFMNILSACSHAGYVKEGRLYFNMMRNSGIEPNLEHFACLIDLLSRAGYLTEAYGILSSKPFPADASIWGALLNGCRIHQRFDMIKIIENLADTSTDGTGYYTLLSIIFAEGGEWDEFRMVRSFMRGMGLKKVHGYSAIEID